MQNKTIKLFDILESDREMTGFEYVSMLSKKEVKKVKAFLTKINGKHVLLRMEKGSYYIGEVVSVEKKSELSFVFNGYDVFSDHVSLIENKNIVIDHVLDCKLFTDDTSYNKKMSFLNEVVNTLKDFSLKYNDVSKSKLDYGIFSDESYIDISELMVSLDDLGTKYKDMKISELIVTFVENAKGKNENFAKIKRKVEKIINKIVVTKDKNTLVSIPLTFDDEPMSIYGRSLIISDNNFLISCFPLIKIDLSNFKDIDSYIVNDNKFNAYFKDKFNLIINTLTSYEKEFSILFGREQS